MKPLLKRLLYWLIHRFGPTIVDQRTGEMLGKGLVVGIGGTVRMLGYGLQQPPVHAVFLPETRILSFSHRIGFATHPPVDFPTVARQTVIANADANTDANTDATSDRVLWVVLAHAPAEHCKKLIDFWHRSGVAPDDLLLVYGGPKDEFARLDIAHARFVPDTDLRTKHHQEEKQSYQSPMREASAWLQDQPHGYVCFVEQDHIPLVSDWGARMVARLKHEDSDVLCNRLRRVDRTDYPHYRYQLSDPKFANAWNAISIREDKNVILSAVGTGHFWKRHAFIETTATPLPTQVYLEEAIPTTAHHLGYRVRDFADQSPFANMHEQRTTSELDNATAAGAWSLHKVKDIELLGRYGRWMSEIQTRTGTNETAHRRVGNSRGSFGDSRTRRATCAASCLESNTARKGA